MGPATLVSASTAVVSAEHLATGGGFKPTKITGGSSNSPMISMGLPEDLMNHGESSSFSVKTHRASHHPSQIDLEQENKSMVS